MAKLRTLSGQDLLAIFGRFGFRPFSQRGSHVKLRRAATSGASQTLTIVLHDEVDRGTLHAIFQQARRFIPESDPRSHFYTD